MDEKFHPVLAVLCAAGFIAAVAWWANGGGRDPEVTPTPSATVTAVASPSPHPSASLAPVEVPDCLYALPPCARLEGGQWFLINDYQGDKRPVKLIGSIVRGDITYRTVKGR